MAQQLSTNTFGVAKWVVSADATQGTHTTIGAAITSASSGDTIYIRDGSYTENLTLKAGVNLAAFSSNLVTPNVIIIGNATAPATGTVTISGIGLQTNSAALLTLSGTSTAIINLIDCNLNCLNNTGITFSSSNAAATINIERCYGNIGTTGIALFSQSAIGALNINYTTINNTGNSTTANTQSAGQLTIDSSYIYSPITTSSTTPILKILNSRIDTSATNTTCITHGSTNASVSNILLSFIASGSASAISVSASATLILSTCTISSTNTNTVTGAGTLQYSANNFPSKAPGTSPGVNVTTLQPKQFGTTIVNSQQPCFLVNLNTSINSVTGDGTAYSVLYDTTTYDQGSNITLNSAGKTIFTAPYTGKYHFDVHITYNGLTAAMTGSIAEFVTTANTVVILSVNPGIQRNAGNIASFAASITLPMTAGDTASILIDVQNGTKAAGLTGAASAVPGYNYFSGYLVC